MTSGAAMEAAVDEITELLDKRIGLRPESTLRGRLRRALRDEVTARGEDLATYTKSLARSQDMLQSLVNRVTVQESGFFRHPDHFAVLADHLLPTFDQPVTIWSAGCANGQEAYSLAMVLQEARGGGSVIASDLSTTALARTNAAVYTSREITGISVGRRERHLSREGEDWRMNRAVRSRVKTMRHNLANELPSHVGYCQLVFCRNVLIYFSPDRAKTFLDRLAAAMMPGAYLFLGSAESLWQVTDGFTAERIAESFVYRRAAVIRRRRAVDVDAAMSAPSSLSRAPSAPHQKAHVPSAPVPSRPLVGPHARAQSPTAATRAQAPTAATRAQAPAADATDVFQPVVLASAGQQALALGDDAAAVVSFRKWVYLTPEDPLASFYLGLALEAGGHTRSAQRSYGVALDVLMEGGPTLGAEIALEGYAPEELLRLLETKQGRSA